MKIRKGKDCRIDSVDENSENHARTFCPKAKMAIEISM